MLSHVMLIETYLLAALVNFFDTHPEYTKYDKETVNVQYTFNTINNNCCCNYLIIL